jgi:hypothetical protein
MGKNFISYLNSDGCKIWLNLDNVLMFEHIMVKQKSYGVKTHVNAYLLQGCNMEGFYDILSINELDEINYKKIQDYLGR